MFPGYHGFGGGWNVGWVERRRLLGFATEFYQTNREGARNGWEASETQHETRSTQPTQCRSPKSVTTSMFCSSDNLLTTNNESLVGPSFRAERAYNPDAGGTRWIPILSGITKQETQRRPGIQVADVENKPNHLSSGLRGSQGITEPGGDPESWISHGAP